MELALGDIGGVGVRAPHDLPKRYWLSLRVPGTFLPFIIKAGTYFIWREGKFRREFWYTTAAKHFLVVNMKSGRYERVVLGLDDAEEWARRIREAMAGE
ncbi:MAG: hypothetical protein FJ317_03125 [SAR202 cluster bacterium]|nr:hypothetical protein [SAR202 cluster bacterium]